METVELMPRLHQVNLDFGQVYLWRDGDELTLVDTGIPGSGTAIESAIAALGHTPGSIAIHLPAHGVLFASDTVACLPETGVIPGAFNVDRAALLDSFRMLADLDPDVVCVGHGTSVVGDAGAAMLAALG